MQRISKKWSGRLSGYRDRQYYATLGGLVLMVPLTLGTLLVLLPNVHGQSKGIGFTEGANGTLKIRGALIESACRLEMSSARQDIQLGETGTSRLRKIGDRGTPVAFQLRLQDCLRSSVGSRDSRTTSLSWAAQQPAVTVSFSAPADADNPQRIKVQGASGVALRITDLLGQDVRLGSRGRPLLLTPGQNTLTYNVALERTRAPLIASAYSAGVDFRLSYD